jgi:polyisoprenoid-binding protein YceI
MNPPSRTAALFSGPRLAAVFAISTACLLAGCSDPADKVAKTQATEAKEATKPPAGAGKEYVVRAESTIGFVGSKVTGHHNGGFKKFAGKVSVAGGKIAASEIRIAMASTWADNDRVTGHLKSPDFFDAAKFPSSTFTLTGIGNSGAQETVTGNLDLHGVTKSITFPADIQITDDKVTVKAEFAINRKDFNINYPDKPNDLIRDNVVLKLEVKATPGETRPEDQLTN